MNGNIQFNYSFLELIIRQKISLKFSDKKVLTDWNKASINFTPILHIFYIFID